MCGGKVPTKNQRCESQNRDVGKKCVVRLTPEALGHNRQGSRGVRHGEERELRDVGVPRERQGSYETEERTVSRKLE